MKWLALLVLALFIYAIFRRMNRDQRISAEASWQPHASDASVPMLQQDELAEPWAGRPPMPFEEFYAHYYADAGLEREYVQRTLDYVARGGGVPASQIRPEDRLDSFPKKGIARSVAFLEKLFSGLLAGALQQQGVSPSELHFETVDDVIRKFEPHKSVVFSHIEKEE